MGTVFSHRRSKPKQKIEHPQLGFLLRGNISDQSLRRIKPNKKLIIFLSSTFTDTYKERNVIQERILPELQKLGSTHDVQVLFYDMRFGVKDENSLDHTTWQCCQEAIKDCKAESDGIFFLSLQGDKYGYRPLPKLIDRAVFEKAIEVHAKNVSIVEISRKWYRLNENHLPAKYELSNLQFTDDKEFWGSVLPRLRDELLHDVPFDANAPELLIARSITEWEVLLAKRLSEEQSTNVWIKREFDIKSFEDIGPDVRPTDFNDSLNDTAVRKHITHLKEQMGGCFEVIDSLSLLKLSVNDYISESAASKEYLEKWEIVVTNLLFKEVEKCVQKNTSWRELALKEYGLPVGYLEEMIHHCTIAHLKASSFIGRNELVEEVLKTIIGSSTHVKKRKNGSSYSAITAAVIGQSGAGKTALMSKVATFIPSRLGKNEDLPIIARYCGTSKFSLHGKDLIYSIGLQLLAINGEKEEIHKLLESMANQSYEEDVEYFSSLLERYPVMLFIDSVDQLSNQDEARSKLSFLKGVKIHKKSKVIISTLPDEYDESKQQWKYRYLCEKVVRDHQIPVVEMKHHSADVATIRFLLERLLERRERKITADQWSVVLKSASQEPTVLYLNLSLEIITKWRSWERNVELRPTVKGLIHQIFEELEKHYGKALVRYAFGFITFSRDGISDQEMKDCLSRPSEVFQEVCQYWQGVQTVPLHVWLRVKQAIKALLAEKDHGCWKWYHRQLWEAAQERYEEVKKDCHRIMGRYFSEQSLCVTELEVWHPDSKVNSRRVKEGYYHLYDSELFEETIEEMCSFEMVCASALCDDAFHFLGYLAKLSSLSQFRSNQRLAHYYRWIRRSISSIAVNPRKRLSVTASEEPTTSLVKQENTRRFLARHNCQGSCSSSVGKMDAVETLGTFPGTDKLEATFQGHTNMVTSVAWNPDGTNIASGSYDKTIRIWDTLTGQLLSTLVGHNGGVTSVAWNHDGSKIASGSLRPSVFVWDAFTRERLNVLEGHTDNVNSVVWSHDSSRLVSGSDDKTVRIWNPNTSKLLLTLTGHTDRVCCVAYAPDGSRIASRSDDKTVKIWDAWTGSLLRTFETQDGYGQAVAWSPDGGKLATDMFPGSDQVAIIDSLTGQQLLVTPGYDSGSTIYSLAWNYNGTRIVVGSVDKTIQIWNAVTGELFAMLQGHDGDVRSVAWKPDGSRIVSGSEDHTVKLWFPVEGSENNQTSHTDAVVAVSWNLDGSNIVSVSEDCSVKIWQATGELLRTLELDERLVISAFLSRDASRVAIGSYGRVNIWNTATGEVTNVLEDEVKSVTWNPDGSRIVSGSNDNTINIWDASTSALLKTLTDHQVPVRVVSYDPDGSRLASGGLDGTIIIWDTMDWRLLLTFTTDDYSFSSITWSPDGSKLVTAGWITVKIWHSSSGELLGTLEGHRGSINAVAWSPDGGKIASGSDDKTVKVWNSSTYELIQTLEGYPGPVKAVSWHLEGTKLVAASQNIVKIHFV